MTNIKLLGALAVFLVIVLAGSSLYNNLNGWFQTALNGPEYCFRDITQTDVSVASQGVSVSYTKTEGDELCFRTKDSSIVERLSQQIQDRKLQENLAKIEANKQVSIFLIIAVTFIIIVIIIYLSTGRNYYGI